jgi:hypothetical protein
VHDPVTATEASVSVELVVGTWDIAVEGLDTEGSVVAEGEATGVVIEERKTTPVVIVLEGLQTGTGTIDVTITWPAEVTVNELDVRLDGAPVGPEHVSTTATSVRYGEQKAAGDYELKISLDVGGSYPTVVTEVVYVFGNVTTQRTIALSQADFTSAPPAPTGLLATAGAAEVVLSWTDNSGVETGYAVERKQGAGSSYAVLAGDLAANTVGYSDGDVLPGMTYYYRVRDFNSFGSSAYSNEVDCSISGEIQIIITVNNPGEESITFSQPDDVVVGVMSVFTVTLSELFDSYAWYLDGLMVGDEAAVHIDCSLEQPGVHHLAVFVGTNGSIHSDTLRFLIEN